MKHNVWIRALAGALVCLLLVGCTAPSEQSGGTSTTATTTTTAPKPIEEINVVEEGVDNTGETDMTEQLTRLHASGKRIYYPNGTYLFNGKNLDLSGGVRFESQEGVLVRNSISDTNILNFDDNGNLIGLMHNHLEYTYDQEGVDTIGNLVFPPVSTADYETRVDLLPYWYNDFGRYSQLASSAWKGWYDWQWNHHNTTQPDPYDPELHPLLGWYRGDEPEVLDWICYWLREYGVNQATLLANSASADRSDGSHWVYNLLHNAPNAQHMQFALHAMSPDSFNYTALEYLTAWDQMAQWFYCNEQYRDQVYCYEENGKRYPIVFVWNEKSIQFAMNNKKLSEVVDFYRRYAQMFQQAGWDGVCIMARTVNSLFKEESDHLTQMEFADVKWFATGYNLNATSRQMFYASMVEGFAPLSNSREWYTVATGLHTHSPHPSNWTCIGNTPAWFQTWLQRAVEATTADPNRAKIITCYNISEWAEGSSSLIPTVGDRFGYLQAVRDTVVVQ